MQPYQTKKRFGQHFLHDPGIISRIIQAIPPTKNLQLLEIGPGLGALTLPLSKLVEHIHIVDIDRDIIKFWAEHNAPNITIHETDALKLDLSAINIKTRPLKIIGNLPYNISTPLIFHLLESADDIDDMIFMLQKEVVDRITATPGNKLYGRLSVMVQYHCLCENLFHVGPGAFNPAPKVDSAVIRLKPTQPKIQAIDLRHLGQTVAAAFSARRKTLRNALKKHCESQLIEKAGIDPGLRAENLSVEHFVTLSNTILQHS